MTIQGSLHSTHIVLIVQFYITTLRSKWDWSCLELEYNIKIALIGIKRQQLFDWTCFKSVNSDNHSHLELMKIIVSKCTVLTTEYSSTHVSLVSSKTVKRAVENVRECTKHVSVRT